MVLPNGGFQSTVNAQPAPAVAGDFCSDNPRKMVLAGPGGLVSGPDGVTIGGFAWATSPDDANGTPAYVYSHGSGLPTGLVYRNQQGLILTYLQQFGMTIPPGFQMALMDGGDMWVVNDGSAPSQAGMKAFAFFANGKVCAKAAGANPDTGGSATGSIAAGTGTFTGSINGDTLTVTAKTNTPIIGALLSGTDGTNAIITGTTIVSAISIDANGLGTYAVSNFHETPVGSCTVTETYGIFTAASALTGTFGVGQALSGSGVTAGTIITQLGTGSGGLGTYYVNLTQTAGSTTISSASDIETKWYVRSSALPGELMKIESQAQG